MADSQEAHGAGSEEEIVHKTFIHDWYIRVKVIFQDTSSLNVADQIRALEENVASLHSTLQNSLSVPDIQFISGRFTDPSDKRTEKSHTSYWLIGLPTMPSSDITEARKITKAWESAEEKVVTKVQAKFVKREVIWQQDFKLDTRVEDMLPSSGEVPKPNRVRTGESFKKIKGSSPSQVRKQFLQHAMGSDAVEVASGKGKGPGGKLRPPRDVLNRLKFDEGYDMNDYVVGYIDRRAGILEKRVAEWQEYEEQELIAYFKYVPEDSIVWDRSRKIDWVFNKRSG